MPVYAWKCPDCERGAEVVRSVKDIDVPPASEDLPKEPFETCEHPSWQRVIALTQPHQHAPGFGRKGHW